MRKICIGVTSCSFHQHSHCWSCSLLRFICIWMSLGWGANYGLKAFVKNNTIITIKRQAQSCQKSQDHGNEEERVEFHVDGILMDKKKKKVSLDNLLFNKQTIAIRTNKHQLTHTGKMLVEKRWIWQHAHCFVVRTKLKARKKKSICCWLPKV